MMSAVDDSVPSTCNICDETVVLAACASCDTAKCTAVICSRCTHEIMRHKADTYLSAPPCPFCSVGFLSFEGVEEAIAVEQQLIMNAARYVGLKDPKGDNDYRRMIDKFKLMGYAGNMSQLTKQEQNQASTSQLRLEVARLSALFEDSSKQLPPGPLEKILFTRKRKHSSVEDHDASCEEPQYFLCPSSPLRASSCSSYRSSTTTRRKGMMRDDVDRDDLLLQRLDGLSNQLESQSQCMNDAAVVQRDLIAKVTGAIESSQLQLQQLGGHRSEEVKPEEGREHHLTMMTLMSQMHQQLMDLSSQVAAIKDSISHQATNNCSSSHHVVVSPMSLPNSDHSIQQQQSMQEMGGPSSRSGSSSSGRKSSIDDDWMIDSWKKEVVTELKAALMIDFEQALNSAVQRMVPLVPLHKTTPDSRVESETALYVEEESDESSCEALREPLTTSDTKESSLVGVLPPSPDTICPNDQALISGSTCDELYYQVLLGARSEFVRLCTMAHAGDSMASCFAASLFFEGNNCCVARNEAKSEEFASKSIPTIRDLSDRFQNKFAQYHLGVFLLRGIGVRKDESEAIRLLTLSANQEYALAQCTLGCCYNDGVGVERNGTKAFEMFLMAAQQQRADGQYYVGCVCEADGHAEKAARYYQLAAQQGYSPAQFRLGCCLEAGIGVAQDELEAFLHYSRAAEQKHPLAQYALGRLYLSGRGVMRSEAHAVRCFQLAADNGQPDAQWELGGCFMNGVGTVKSEGMAVYYRKLAADQGHQAAQYAMGDYYLNGVGVVANEAMAARYYKLSADQGNMHAQFNIATSYQDGRGVKADSSEAVRYFQLAALQGHAMSQFCLGCCYAKGSGVEQSDVEAVRCYRLAVDRPHGYFKAQYALGLCLEKGRGVERNDAEAVQYYQLAAEQGYHQAQYSLGSCCEKGKGISKSEEVAVLYYKLAADQGNVQAMHCLALCFAHGRGVAAADLSQAMEYYDRASAKGSTARIDMLERERGRRAKAHAASHC